MTPIEENTQNKPHLLSIQTQQQIDQQTQLSAYSQFPRAHLIRLELNEPIPYPYVPPKELIPPPYKPPNDKYDWPDCDFRSSRQGDFEKHKENVHLKIYKLA